MVLRNQRLPPRAHVAISRRRLLTMEEVLALTSMPMRVVLSA